MISLASMHVLVHHNKFAAKAQKIMTNKPRKNLHYRFDVNVSSLWVKDAFVGRPKCTRQ